MSNSFKNLFSEAEIKAIQENHFGQIRNNSEIFHFLKNLWRFNFSTIGFENLVDEIFGVIRFSNNKTDEQIIEEINLVLQDKEFKRHGRKTRKHSETKMQFGYDMIKDYLNGFESFLDFGSGKMALIRRIVKENTNIKNFYAFDPKSNPEFTSFDERVKFLTEIEELRKLKNIDLVYCSTVLHHLTEKEIKESLEAIKNVLKPGGKFLLLEESFPTQNILTENSLIQLNEIGYKQNTELTEQFNKLTEKEKFLAIYLNDVLINLKNLSYMPWTFEYKTMEEWRNLVESFGFKTEEEYYFGIVKSGRLKQGMISLQVFEG